MQDQLNRRKVLQCASGSVGVALSLSGIQSVTAANSGNTPPGLYNRPYKFLELDIETDVDTDGAKVGASDRALPTFGIGDDVDSTLSENSVFIPEASKARLSLDEPSPVVATHEGIQQIKDGEIEFSSIPVSGNSYGSSTTIQNSDGFSLEVDERGEQIEVSKNGSSMTLSKPDRSLSVGTPRGKDREGRQPNEESIKFSHTISPHDREAKIEIHARYHGEMRIIGHESSIVLPINEGTKKIVERAEMEGLNNLDPRSADDHDVFIIERGDQ